MHPHASAEEWPPGRAIRRALFFVLALAYLYLLVDPKLVFFAHGTLANLDAYSRPETLSLGVWERVGGPAEWASANLMKWFGRPWMGPAVLTLLAALLFLSANRLATTIHGPGSEEVGYIPVALLMAIAGGYYHPFFGLTYACPMALAVTAAALYSFLPDRVIVRLPALILLSGTVYLVGGGAFLFLAATCAALEFRARRRVAMGLAAVALGGSVPFLLGCLLHGASPVEAYLRLTPFDPSAEVDARVLACALCLFVPLEMLLPRQKDERGHASPALTWTVESLLLLVLAMVIAGGNLDRQLHTALEHGRGGLGGAVRVPVFFTVWVSLAALGAAVMAAGLYARLPLAKAWARWATWLGLSLAVGCYAGGATLLVFVGLCVVYETVFRRRWVLGAACLFSAAAPAAVWFLWLRDSGIAERYGLWLSSAPGWDPRARTVATRLLTGLPFIAAMLSVGYARFRRDAEGAGRRIWDRRLGVAGAWACRSLLLLAVAAGVLGRLFDWESNARLRVHLFAREGRWREVLREERRMRCPDAATRLDAQRALYHTGRLTDDLMAYPPSPFGVNYVRSWPEEQEEASLYAELYLDMGWLNAAEEFAQGALALGDHPLLLRLLGRIYTAKGCDDTARVFLDALRRDPSCGHWADERPAVSPPAKTLVWKRELYSARPVDQLDNLRNLLDADPTNRMAFEFRMAALLLSRRLDEFATELPEAKEAGCTGRMRVFQEACLVRAGRADAEAPIPIDPETRERFREFQAAAAAESREDCQALMRRFGNTYFFYYRLGGGGKP